VAAFAADAEVSPTPETPDTRVTELQTAGYYELVTRARELGLAVTGGVPELRERIAKAWNLELPPVVTPSGRTLTIDSAQEAGLVAVDAPGDGKLLRLSGGLHVTLVDNEKNVTHVIEAGELWYDQANEEMTARGKVVYTMIRESSREVFRGESLTFRLSDSQGVFYGGASDRSRAVGDKTLVFRYQGDAIRRSSEDLVVLETGTITSSLGSDPYYHIQAKKIWVLAPGEWGLQEAVLYLGRIPVLYFPFFFQPGDEFFFNPVLSFPDAGDRRGTSLQTTTYIFGKKKRDTAPLSFLQIEDSSTKDEGKVLKGLFLVRGTPPKSDVPASWTLKLLADFYSNLGYLTAIDATLPGLGGTKNLTFFAGAGITRTVDATGTPFSLNPFQTALDPWNQSNWNSVRFGWLPLRWGGATAVDTGWGAASFEYYTDPLLYNDLTGSRSENFSVFSLLGLGAAKKTATATAKSSLRWAASLTLLPVSVTSSLSWDTKAASPVPATGDPETTFYLPSQMILPQASLSLGGELWPWPTEKSPLGPKASDPVSLVPPGGNPVDPPEKASEEAADSEVDLLPPGLMDSQTEVAATPEWTTTASWSLKPEGRVETNYDVDSVNKPTDSLWTIHRSRWYGAYDGRLSWNTGWSDGSWTTNQAITLHQQTQDMWYLGPTVTKVNAATYSTQDQQGTSGLLNQVLGSTWKPWAGQGAWRESNLQYTLSTKLWQYKGESDSTLYFNGTSDTVTSHQTNAQAIYYLWEGTPIVKVLGGWQNSLPPLDLLRVYSSGLEVTYPWLKTSTKASARQTSETLTWDPWITDATWSPMTDVSLNEVFQWDLDKSRPSTSTTIFTAFGASAQYRHQRTTPYTFVGGSVLWKRTGEDAFLPQELRFGYTLNLPSVQWWYYRNTLSSQVAFSWPINLQKYSDMPMTLNYTVSYKLHRFLELQVTEGIVNRTAYLYFPEMARTFGLTPVNPLVDFWNSVSLWDQRALHQTGFKMTNLSLALVHYLDDWQIKLDYTGSPQLNTAGTQYDWKGTLTLLVQWYPVPELKTQMNWDKEGTLTVAKNGS